MFKITGLDKLTRELREAEKALSELDGTIGTVSFNPHDPSSIEAAIQQVDALINERLGSYSSNSVIRPLAAKMKERYHQAILDRAATLRLEGGKAS